MNWKTVPHPTAFALFGSIWELEISGIKIHVYQNDDVWVMDCNALRFVLCPLKSEELLMALNEAVTEIKDHLTQLNKYLSMSIIEVEAS